MFHQKPVSKSMQEAMASDPSVMVDMMKKNLTGIVPQVRLHGAAALRALEEQGAPPRTR